MQIFRPDEEGSDHHISNNHKNWSAFDCRNTDPIELGGIPDKIPIFKEYSKENVSKGPHFNLPSSSSNNLGSI